MCTRLCLRPSRMTDIFLHSLPWRLASPWTFSLGAREELILFLETLVLFRSLILSQS